MIEGPAVAVGLFLAFGFTCGRKRFAQRADPYDGILVSHTGCGKWKEDRKQNGAVYNLL